MLDKDDYFRRWAQLHGGYDPAAHLLARTWLTAVYALARPCRGVPPLAITAAGLLVAVAVPWLAARDWAVLAAVAVAVSGVLDSLDGAVAVGTGRDTRLGFVLDSVADRVSDTAYVVAFFVLGAPGWWCATAAGLCALQEYLRARAAAAGMDEIGIVTVFERPTRTVLAVAVVAGASLPSVLTDVAVAAGAAAWAALAAVALGQLSTAVRRTLR